MDIRPSFETLAEAWVVGNTAAPSQDPKSPKGSVTHAASTSSPSAAAGGDTLYTSSDDDDEEEGSEEEDDDGEEEGDGGGAGGMLSRDLQAHPQQQQQQQQQQGRLNSIINNNTNSSDVDGHRPYVTTPLLVPTPPTVHPLASPYYPHHLHPLLLPPQPPPPGQRRNDEDGRERQVERRDISDDAGFLPTTTTSASGASPLRDSPATPVTAAASSATTMASTTGGGLAVAGAVPGRQSVSPRKPESATPGIASMPIRCLVEHVTGPVTFDTASSAACELGVVGQDAFAILPVNTPLRDLVRAALARLGYSPSECASARGAIQLKNWKPLSFDIITDDRAATIDDILRELKEYTLRIRLSSQPRQKSVDEMKEKLLQLLLTTSHTLLVDSGCPVEKGLLMLLSKGETFPNIPDDVVASFDSWYSRQIAKTPGPDTQAAAAPEGLAHNLSKKDSDSDADPDKVHLPVKVESDTPLQHQQHAAVSPVVKVEPFTQNATSVTSVVVGPVSVPSSQQQQQHRQHQQQFLASGMHFPHGLQPGTQPVPHHGGVVGGPGLASSGQTPVLGPSKTRIRTSFDPEHEIPRLQKWFHQSQHPSREQMMRYMHELNNLESRKGRRPLDLTNIIYWFKNARAAQRRASKTQDDSFENEENVDISNSGHVTPSLTSGSGSLAESPAMPPYLPNKNAVYIVPFPFHSPHTASVSSNPLISTPDTLGDSNDEPCDLSIKKFGDQPCSQHDPRTSPAGLKGSDDCPENGDLLCSRGGRSSSSQSRKGSPVRNGYLRISQEEDYSKSLSVFNGQESRKTSTPLSKNRSREREPSSDERSRTMLEKHYQQFQELRHQGMVMDFKKEADLSDAESCQSNDTDEDSGRLRIREEELEYSVARVRAEMGLGLSQLAATSEASMAALSLAQMSQPQAMLSITPHHMNSLAMYYNLAPRYYHSSSPHPAAHHHSQATAAMVAALSGSGHMNGHGATAAAGGGGNHHGASSVGNPQSPAAAGGRPVSILPKNPHHPLSSQGRERSSEPRKRRTRVFIDPLTEIPRLEKWFQEDTHPSAYMIDKYTETLNKAEYRQKFPKLEAKNIQLWFKNHRAKVKRQRVGGPGGSDSVCDSPPPTLSGSRSQTPVNLSGTREGSGGVSGASPEKQGSDVDQGHCDDDDDMEEGEQ